MRGGGVRCTATAKVSPPLFVCLVHDGFKAARWAEFATPDRRPSIVVTLSPLPRWPRARLRPSRSSSGSWVSALRP
jgi:hypothetical protein